MELDLECSSASRQPGRKRSYPEFSKKKKTPIDFLDRYEVYLASEKERDEVMAKLEEIITFTNIRDDLVWCLLFDVFGLAGCRSIPI